MRAASHRSENAVERLERAGESLPRGRVGDIQRARMLTAMFDVASERGAAKTSVAHIVARSGVSRRTFYEHFTDREDCFLAAFDEAIRCSSEAVLDAYAGADSWRERMRAGLSALLRFLDEQPATGRLMVVEALGAGPKALERRRQTLAVAIAAVDEGRSESRAGADPSPLTAEGVIGAVFAVVHTRMLEPGSESLAGLTGYLMSIVVLPYLGAAAARREARREPPKIARATTMHSSGEDPLRGLDMRLTYRTVRVLLAIGAHPRASNRQIAEVAEVSDQGQMSKLLTRLQRLGLVYNQTTASNDRGEPNAWTLTSRGQDVEQTINAQAAHRAGL
jgi:AcrR family transcriptional regulator